MQGEKTKFGEAKTVIWSYLHTWKTTQYNKSAKEAKSNSSSTKWTKSSRVQRLFCNSALTCENRSKNTPSLLCMVLHKIQGTGLCSCGLVILFNSAASFTKQDFESMDSTLFFLFSYRNYRYTDPKYCNPTSFLFRKVSTQTLATLVPFLPFFSNFSDFLGF
jgi:hypothetical protein